jgi:hypothetical protein
MRKTLPVRIEGALSEAEAGRKNAEPAQFFEFNAFHAISLPLDYPLGLCSCAAPSLLADFVLFELARPASLQHSSAGFFQEVLQ